MKQSKVLLILFVTLMMSVQGECSAMTFNKTIYVDGVGYNLWKDNIIINGHRLWQAWVCSYSGSQSTLTIPEQIKDPVDNNTYYVTAIQNSALKNNSVIKQVSLPYSLTQVQEYAFYGCKNLEKVTFRRNPTDNSPSLSIYSRAFSSCPALKEVKFPNNLNTIGSYAFSCCYELSNIHNFKAENKNGVFANEINLTTISTSAFENCFKLKFTDLPYNLKTIKSYAFDGCNSIDSIFFYNIVSIGDFAFYSCDALKKIKFYLTKIETIGEQAFCECEILASVQSYVSSAWTPMFPSGLKTIGASAFKKTALTSFVVDGSSLTSIGERAFQYCDNLELVELPSSLPLETGIGNLAFDECPKLSKVSVQSTSTTPYKITATTFTGKLGAKTSATLILPGNSTQKINYKSATGWKDFSTVINNSRYVECAK